VSNLSKQQIYEFMYYDLLSNKLDVYLIPSTNPDRANNGCCSRQVATSNPVWYQDFCSLFLDKRKKTIIKCKDTLELLNRLKDGKAIKSKYLFGTFPEPFEHQF
jgi:hypothetical protein